MTGCGSDLLSRERNLLVVAPLVLVNVPTADKLLVFNESRDMTEKAFFGVCGVYYEYYAVVLRKYSRDSLNQNWETLAIIALVKLRLVGLPHVVETALYHSFKINW